MFLLSFFSLSQPIFPMPVPLSALYSDQASTQTGPASAPAHCSRIGAVTAVPPPQGSVPITGHLQTAEYHSHRCLGASPGGLHLALSHLKATPCCTQTGNHSCPFLPGAWGVCFLALTSHSWDGHKSRKAMVSEMSKFSNQQKGKGPRT